MKKFRGAKGMIIIIVLFLLIVGYYFYLTNVKKTNEEQIELSEAQEIILTDFTRNYPPSPKEVVKFYLETTKCLYNEKLSEEDVVAIGIKMQEIYDRELVLNKVQEEYLKDLKSEIAAFQEGNCSIINYSISKSTDVDYFSEDGYHFARLYGTFYLRVDKSMKSLEQVFILREDEEKHWKIYGWKPVEGQEETENE